MHPTLLRSQGFQIKILAASVTGGRDSIKCQCVAPVQNVIRHLLVHFIHYNGTLHCCMYPCMCACGYRDPAKANLAPKTPEMNFLHAEQGKEEVKKSRVEITVCHRSISVHIFTVAICMYVRTLLHALYTYICTYAHTYICTYVHMHIRM